MKNSFDTSFIPQQPLLKAEGLLRRREPINFALMIALVLFFTSLGVSLGMYFYKANVDKRIITLEKQLQSKEAGLKIDDIDRYSSIDARLTIAKKLLQNHTAFSAMLTLLEEITAQNVGWTSMSYNIDEITGATVVSLGGIAPSYSAVYAQAQSLRNMQPTVKSVEVSTPALNPESGVVTFGAELVINPTVTNYAQLIRSEEASGQETTTTVPESVISLSQTP